MKRRARNPRGRDVTRRELERYGDPSTEEYWLAVGQELRRQGDPGFSTPHHALWLPGQRPGPEPTEPVTSWPKDRHTRAEVAFWLRGMRHDRVGDSWWAEIMAHAVSSGILWPDRWNEAIHTYVSPRTRKLTDHEEWVRGVAYNLKRRDQGADAMNDRMIAAGAMFPYVPPDAVLVPVPPSVPNPDLGNPATILAEEIAWFHHDSSVIEAVRRRSEIMPSHQRRRYGSPGATLGEHLATMQLVERVPLNRPVVIVDNHVTTGATIEAVRRLIERPDAHGLAWSQELQ